jgi:RND family efflux transporter MFP subunit
VGALEAMMSYTRIVAPFDGVITGRFADPGALIRAGGPDAGSTGSGARIAASAVEGAGSSDSSAPVLTLADIDQLRVYVYVPEQDAPEIRVGTPAIVTTRGIEGRDIRASVSRFASSLDLATRTMLTEIDLSNPQHQLYPRMYARVTLDLVRHPDAIQLPTQAVSTVGDHRGVVLLVRDRELHKTPVSLGISDGRTVEITSGLNTGDSVAAIYSSTLSDGEQVRVVGGEPRNNQVASDD